MTKEFKLYEKVVTRINDFGSEEDCIPVDEVKTFIKELKEWIWIVWPLPYDKRDRLIEEIDKLSGEDK